MLIGVTGATGFLGRHIVRRLVAAGHTCRCWHRPKSDRSGFDDLAGGIEWTEGTLGDTSANAALTDGVDAVVHAALERYGAGFRASADESVLPFLQANLMGSLQLIERARLAGVGRFVFISTCALHEVILDDRPLDEAHPLWATGHYGAHKAAIEAFVSSFGRGKDLNICSLRPTGIYGVNHPPRRSKWFDIVSEVVAGKPFSSDSGGKEVHAADVAKAVELLLNADGTTGECYNCYDTYIAQRHVAELAKEISGSDSEIGGAVRGPKHQIETGKIRKLGMTFGGEALLRETITKLVEAARAT